MIHILPWDHPHSVLHWCSGCLYLWILANRFQTLHMLLLRRRMGGYHQLVHQRTVYNEAALQCSSWFSLHRSASCSSVRVTANGRTIWYVSSCFGSTYKLNEINYLVGVHWSPSLFHMQLKCDKTEYFNRMFGSWAIIWAVPSGTKHRGSKMLPCEMIFPIQFPPHDQRAVYERCRCVFGIWWSEQHCWPFWGALIVAVLPFGCTIWHETIL